MEALQALGKKLCELKVSQLDEIPIGDKLRHAIDEYRTKITQREARRRQMQFIGKLMRSEDFEAIESALSKFDASSQAFTQALHESEIWRERLINEGKTSLTEFVETFPAADVQRVRQLIRAAQKDIQNNKNTGAAKKLFQFIKESIHQAQ